MKEEFLKDFVKKYENRLNEKKVIELLLDNKNRKSIIESDDFNPLILIASSNNNKLKSFYFNGDTISHILYSKVLLKDRLYRLMQCLQNDFRNNIKIFPIVLQALPDESYFECLILIANELKQMAKENNEMSFDEFFKTIRYSNISFNELENIIHNFKEVNNLYYSPTILFKLINISFDLNKLVLDERELIRLKNYIFNDYCKKMFLKNFKYSFFDKLYKCFSNKFIDYFLDDYGLIILEKNNKFYKLFIGSIPFDSLSKSKLFALLMSKNFKDPKTYDIQLNRIKFYSSYDSFYNLLGSYIQLKDYYHFYKVFSMLPVDKQIEYFNTNCEQLLKLNNSEIFKGMKKELYEMFKDKVDIKICGFSGYDLWSLLNNKECYSLEQLENILSVKENILEILKGDFLESTYKMIFDLNIPSLKEIYMSEEILSILKNLNKLDKIYKISQELEIDVSKIFLNTERLIDVGEKVLDNIKIRMLRELTTLPTCTYDDEYYHFISKVSSLENNILFKVLDFYLRNVKYISTFYLLRDRIERDVFQEYLISRKDLITEVVQKNECDLSLLLRWDLYGGKQFFKERENVVLYLTRYEYYFLFHSIFEGKYRLGEKVLNDTQFIKKFIDDDRDIEEFLRYTIDNEDLIKKLLIKIRIYKKMKKILINGLNDSANEFTTYLEILMNSGIDVSEIEFLKDMIDVFFNKRIKEIFIKYKNVNLEKMKLEILNKVIKSSRENIARSITNPLRKNIIDIEYFLDGEKITVPTIIYDSETFIFLVRRMSSKTSFYDEYYKNKIEYFSTITEKNRSMFYGDSGIKFGYAFIKPKDIVHVNSFDSACKESSRNKYIGPYIKYPEWVSMQTLNERTLKNKSYNELRIKGEYIPDFVISYDEPNEDDLSYSFEHNVPIVKILRKSYPNAIEQFNDPYALYK